MGQNKGLQYWRKGLDGQVPPSSRWKSTQRGLVRTGGLLGDHLAVQLREAAQRGVGGGAIAYCAIHLVEQLKAYEREPRLLIKLADTGRVVQTIQKAIDSALDVLKIRGTPEAETWHQQLQDERDERVDMYNALLRDQDRLQEELGDEKRQVEIQTLLKHDLEKNGSVLTPEELDVISAAFDAAVEVSGILVAGIPTWFATSESEWHHAVRTTMSGGEEACLRQASEWSRLHHPNVRKFYGAYHVSSSPFVIHNWARRIGSKEGYRWSWSNVAGCACGVRYVHDRGLVHQHLTADHLCERDRGILSAAELVRSTEGELSQFNGPLRHEPTLHSKRTSADIYRPSTLRDVWALGVAIWTLLLKHRAKPIYRRRHRDLPPNQLPDIKPRFLNSDEWALLQGMCAPDPADRISMMEVVHQMAALVENEKASYSPEKHLSKVVTVDDVRKYQVSSLGQTLSEVFKEAELICDEAEPELAAVHRPVLDRLVDVYEQLLVAYTPPPLQLMDKFSDIAQRFFITLERRAEDSFGYSMASVASLCASRTVAGRSYGIHHDIDRLLREFSTLGLDGSGAVHQWQPSWKQVRRRQQQTLQTWAEDPSLILQYLDNDMDRSEALALLQFEANGIGAGDKLSASPPWYIPPHLVELGKHLADGSFGAVYEGMYLDTPVVVKQVLPGPDGIGREEREQFLREVKLWFSLNHTNLVKLYGACHEGRPFFVCERAMGGSIGTSSRSEFRSVWWPLKQAALGLKHLHKNGIVHGDLKGNNILIGEEGIVKLADFGLSFISGGTDANTAASSGALGAYRWKAPEVLQGGAATFASDIYSFGMCIIEAVTGQFPWGNSIPDVAVKFKVVEQRKLPERPASFTDSQWDLVTRMCCYDPEERITADTMADIIEAVGW